MKLNMGSLLGIFADQVLAEGLRSVYAAVYFYGGGWSVLVNGTYGTYATYATYGESDKGGRRDDRSPFAGFGVDGREDRYPVFRTPTFLAVESVFY